MKMSNFELITYLAKLSGLDFPENRLAEVAEEMKEIITLMDEVKSFDDEELQRDVRDAARLTLPTEYDCLRTDKAELSPCVEKMLSNTKEKNDLGIIVPKIV